MGRADAYRDQSVSKASAHDVSASSFVVMEKEAAPGTGPFRESAA